MNWTPPMVLTLEKKCSSCISLMFLQCCQSDTSSVPMASWDSNNADGLLFDHCIMIPWHSESYSFDVPHFTKCITKKYMYQTQRESLNLSHRRFLRHRVMMEQSCRNSWGNQSDEGSRGHISHIWAKSSVFIQSETGFDLSSGKHRGHWYSMLRKH